MKKLQFNYRGIDVNIHASKEDPEIEIITRWKDFETILYYHIYDEYIDRFYKEEGDDNEYINSYEFISCMNYINYIIDELLNGADKEKLDTLFYQWDDYTPSRVDLFGAETYNGWYYGDTTPQETALYIIGKIMAMLYHRSVLVKPEIIKS